jgi:hypothetical protein
VQQVDASLQHIFQLSRACRSNTHKQQHGAHAKTYLQVYAGKEQLYAECCPPQEPGNFSAYPIHLANSSCKLPIAQQHTQSLSQFASSLVIVAGHRQDLNSNKSKEPTKVWRTIFHPVWHTPEQSQIIFRQLQAAHASTQGAAG